MTDQVERDGYDQFWDVVESEPVHHGHIVQPIDALRSAWLVRDLTEDDFRAARTAIAAFTMTPQEAAKPSDRFHKEQVHIWAQEILEALALNDLLRLETYDDKVLAHEAVSSELVSIGAALDTLSMVERTALRAISEDSQ